MYTYIYIYIYIYTYIYIYIHKFGRWHAGSKVHGPPLASFGDLSAGKTQGIARPHVIAWGFISLPLWVGSLDFHLLDSLHTSF